MTKTGEKRRRLGGREATAAQIPGAYAISVGDTGAPLPQGWKRHLLSDLARMESGHTPSRRHPEYWGGSIPWIGIRDATGNHGRTIYETNESTNALGIANSASRVLPKDTVCLSRTASVGYVVVMGREMATSQDFANWICGPDLDYRYLKYALIAEGDALLNFASGSVHQTIYFPELKSFYIAAPEKPEQSAIADILSALDDKIELNRRMNETLEGIAQAIFRDWFVDFGPVRRRVAGEVDPVAIMGGLTPDIARADEIAPLFPTTFGDGGLPAGWKAGTLDRVALVNSESWKTRNHPAQVEYVDLSNTKWGTIETTNVLTWEQAPSRARRIARNGDTIVGTVRPGNGSYAYIGRDGYTVSTGFAVLRPKQDIYTDAIYVAATAGVNITRLANLADGHGGAYPAVNPDVVAATPFPNVPDALLAAFATFASPMRAKIEQAKIENQTLAETRNYLLPRLMSGAVRVAPKAEVA